MSSNIAALGHLGFRREESFASGGAINEYVPIISEDLQMIDSYHYGDAIMASAQQRGGRYMQQSVTGSITLPVSPAMSETFYRCGIGQSSSPYYPARPLESIAIEVDRQQESVYCSGDMIGSMEFNSEQGGELQCVIAIEGKGFIDQSSASSPSFTSGDDPYLHSEATFTIDGSETQNVTAFSLSVENNLVTDLYANQQQRRIIPATKVVVTGSITLLFESSTEYDLFIAKSEVTIQAAYNRGGNSVTFLVNKARLDTFNAPLSGQSDYITETFAFTGYTDDPSSERVISVTVV